MSMRSTQREESRSSREIRGRSQSRGINGREEHHLIDDEDYVLYYDLVARRNFNADNGDDNNDFNPDEFSYESNDSDVEYQDQDDHHGMELVTFTRKDGTTYEAWI
ncbi:hypothetical protein EIN_326380 [Entamoeba invadens IP1]|uniref:Uncharacterized protein n=1 Tax=Entamoeba invadens IP1 TaxID=370355 RepID=L7FL17_ENTIV|nr:hypothetical protein EIN_326380 [Entamoeba invadens IP1]ELP87567.1 hypothetical protein EIN_326380 [Entamoeba invadens IP1]|eukprot:XP_004254338.1 hypothetical protein EIN_326380 [Entamoeba invadens IP1]